jgi:hypothetical protein
MRTAEDAFDISWGVSGSRGDRDGDRAISDPVVHTLLRCCCCIGRCDDDDDDRPSDAAEELASDDGRRTGGRGSDRRREARRGGDDVARGGCRRGSIRADDAPETTTVDSDRRCSMNVILLSEREEIW